MTTHLLVRVDSLRKWTDFRGEVVAISRAISAAQTQPTPMDIGAMSKGAPQKGRQTRQSTTASMSKMRKHRSHFSELPPLRQDVPKSAEKSVTWRMRVDLLEHRSPRQREAARRAREAIVQVQSVNTCWSCGETGHKSSQRFFFTKKRKAHAVDDVTTASQVGSQDTTMVGASGSCFDFGSMSEGIPEPRSAGAKICSVGVPSVCAADIVDIEVDSGAEMSCLPASIGADTCPLHETRLSMCGGHHVVAGGSKLAQCQVSGAAGALQKHQQNSTKGPQERERRKKIVAGGGTKKARNFGRSGGGWSGGGWSGGGLSGGGLSSGGLSGGGGCPAEGSIGNGVQGSGFRVQFRFLGTKTKTEQKQNEERDE